MLTSLILSSLLALASAAPSVGVPNGLIAPLYKGKTHAPAGV